jgi:hypothetical protein
MRGYRFALSGAAMRTVRMVRADIADLERTDPLFIPLERVAARIVAMAADVAGWQGKARTGAASGQVGYRASLLSAAARELARGEA